MRPRHTERRARIRAHMQTVRAARGRARRPNLHSAGRRSPSQSAPLPRRALASAAEMHEPFYNGSSWDFCRHACHRHPFGACAKATTDRQSAAASSPAASGRAWQVRKQLLTPTRALAEHSKLSAPESQFFAPGSGAEKHRNLLLLSERRGAAPRPGACSDTAGCRWRQLLRFRIQLMAPGSGGRAGGWDSGCR